MTVYTVTADYTGQVSKTNCEVVIYTAIFGSTETPKESAAPDAPSESAGPDGAPVSSVNWAELKTPLLTVGAVLILAAGGVFIFKKFRR